MFYATAIPFTLAAVFSVVSRILPLKNKPQKVVYLAPSTMPFLTVLMVLFFLVYVAMTGVGNLFLSRLEKVTSDGGAFGSTIFYGAEIVTACLAASIQPALRGRPFSSKIPYFLQFGVVLACLALTSNPINSPRYFVIAAWMPMFFIMLNGRVGAMLIYAAIAAALIVAMPVMSVTSRFGLDGLENLDNFGQYVFKIPYIDVFDMLVYEITYIGQNGYFWGEKTLGAILFFVPRSIWTGKATLIALDMGELLVSLKIAGTDNLSMFFGGEFYADGGISGVFLGSLALAVALYGLAFRRAFTVNNIGVPSLILMAALPILLRGPIGANLPLTVSEYVVLFGLVMVLGQVPQRRATATMRQKKRPMIVADHGPTQEPDLPPIRWDAPPPPPRPAPGE